MEVQIWPEAMVPIDLIDLDEQNPNEQSPEEFSALVDEVIENGWRARVEMVGPYPNGRYKMFSGEHRYKVATVLEMPEVPAILVPVDAWEEDQRRVQLVKQNILHGSLNPAKFTDLFNDLTKRHEIEVVQRMMGFTKQDAFDRLYEDAKKALPPEMQKRLEEVRDELKTIDDLSLVLNRLFTEFGDTLDSNFMFLTWGGEGARDDPVAVPGVVEEGEGVPAVVRRGGEAGGRGVDGTDGLARMSDRFWWRLFGVEALLAAIVWGWLLKEFWVFRRLTRRNRPQAHAGPKLAMASEMPSVVERRRA